MPIYKYVSIDKQTITFVYSMTIKDATLKPKSVIRPKQKDYDDIIASFQLLSAFLSSPRFHLRFGIARYAFNAGCRNLLETNTKKI